MEGSYDQILGTVIALYGGTEKTHVNCHERWSLGEDLNRNLVSQLMSYEDISNEISCSIISACIACCLNKSHY
jgi:hypothetical protein